MVTIEKIPCAAQPLVPWRNGGGVTREVARADGQGGFRWRVSVAQVASDGPFSSYPGVDRLLWLLRGAGMELRMPNGVQRLDRRFAKFAFAGEMPVDARLLDGPTEDLNVMTQRATTRCDAEIVELAGERAWELADAGEALVLALDGEVVLSVPGAPEIALAEGDALLLAEAAGARPSLRASVGAVLLARFVVRRSAEGEGSA